MNFLATLALSIFMVPMALAGGIVGGGNIIARSVVVTDQELSDIFSIIEAEHVALLQTEDGIFEVSLSDGNVIVIDQTNQQISVLEIVSQ